MSDNPSDCGICYHKHVTKPATHWCSECDQSYCDDCIINHGFIKASKNHQTVPFRDYLELKNSFRLVESKCKTHDEKYQLFCQPHDILLCHECVEEHSKCDKVISLSKVTKNIKDSETLKDNQQ